MSLESYANEKIQFVQELLRTIADTPEDGNAVCQLFNKNEDKLDVEFVEMMHFWASSAIKRVNLEQHKDEIVQLLLHAFVRLHELSSRKKSDNIELSIQGLERLLDVCKENNLIQSSIETMHNLGLVYANRINENKRSNIARAISFSKKCCSVGYLSVFLMNADALLYLTCPCRAA